MNPKRRWSILSLAVLLAVITGFALGSGRTPDALAGSGLGVFDPLWTADGTTTGVDSLTSSSSTTGTSTLIGIPTGPPGTSATSTTGSETVTTGTSTSPTGTSTAAGTGTTGKATTPTQPPPRRGPVGNVTEVIRPLAAPARVPAGGHWVAAWGAAMQPPSPDNLHSQGGFDNVTLRQIVFSSAGGSAVRVHLTNLYGATPLTVGRASLAQAGSGGSLGSGPAHGLTFSGAPTVTIPAGGSVWSDPVALKVAPLEHLAVSVWLPKATGPATQHDHSNETNYLAGGAHVFDSGGGAYGTRISAWYFLDGVQLLSSHRDLGALVALGDSITSGVGSSDGAWAAWPDDLARRFAPSAASAVRGSTVGSAGAATGASSSDTLSVIDEGIGGNRVLNPAPCCGQAAWQRFGAELAAVPGAREVIVLEGINDINYGLQTSPDTAPHTVVDAAQIIGGYKAIIAEAHAHHLQAWGATLLPFHGDRYWTPAGEEVRDEVNAWILHSRAFDGVIDLARVVEDPRDPWRLDPAYDSGDHLHPNNAGYRAMAAAINLSDLLR